MARDDTWHRVGHRERTWRKQQVLGELSFPLHAPSPVPKGPGARRHSPTLRPVRPGAAGPATMGWWRRGEGESFAASLRSASGSPSRAPPGPPVSHPSPEGEQGISEAPSGGSDPNGWRPSVLGWVPTWVQVDVASGTMPGGLGAGVACSAHFGQVNVISAEAEGSPGLCGQEAAQPDSQWDRPGIWQEAH